MKQYTVNFIGVNTCQEFYERLITGLEFPDWCGKNMSAIWDLLTGYLDFPSMIYVKGIDNLPELLQKEKQLILEIFDRTVVWYAKLDCKVEICFL